MIHTGIVNQIKLIFSYNKDKFLINDPNCSLYSLEPLLLVNCFKNFFLLLEYEYKKGIKTFSSSSNIYYYVL